MGIKEMKIFEKQYDGVYELHGEGDHLNGDDGYRDIVPEAIVWSRKP